MTCARKMAFRNGKNLKKENPFFVGVKRSTDVTILWMICIKIVLMNHTLYGNIWCYTHTSVLSGKTMGKNFNFFLSESNNYFLFTKVDGEFIFEDNFLNKVPTLCLPNPHSYFLQIFGLNGNIIL